MTVDGRTVEVTVERVSMWGSQREEEFTAQIDDSGSISVFAVEIDLPVKARIAVVNGHIQAKLGDCDYQLQQVE